jgi:hypothetical protein
MPTHGIEIANVPTARVLAHPRQKSGAYRHGRMILCVIAGRKRAGNQFA